MEYTYKTLDAKYVFATLGKGATVLLIDFANLRVLNCEDMKVSAISAFINSKDVIFYTREEVVVNG